PRPTPAPRPARHARPMRPAERAPVQEQRALEEARPVHRCPPDDPRCANRDDEAESSGGGEVEASVRPLALTIEHGISADVVQPVMRAAVPALRACYERELRRRPATGGRVT